ncbi:MAG: hypothetical protein AAF741_15255 [Bacteroidota bacterium]
MNRQTFQTYLQEPSKLYQLSLTELQGLVLDYPYSANLRLLLLLKTKMEGHPIADQITAQVAARTFDRAHLYDLLRKLDAEVELEVDTLELLELEREKEVIEVPQNTSDEPRLASLNASDEFASTEARSSEASSEASSSEVSGFARFTPPRSSPPARRLGGESARLQRLKSRQLARISARLRGEGSDNAQAKLRRIARRSVAKHRGVASPTLAELLVRQEQYQRAIKMYEELSLAQPEKKATFAGRIKELKKKL